MPDIEVLAGTHLVAAADGVLIVVANREDAPATRASAAGAALLEVQGLVRAAAKSEKQRSGKAFARLATNWLMGLADEEAVEFGVLTPTTTGVAVFLHGRVSAVLAGAERSEVLRGGEAGFTVDRLVIPGPEVGAGVFVDEGDQQFDLPGVRGVCVLADGAVPGSGGVLWYGQPVYRPPAERPTTRDRSQSAADHAVAQARSLSKPRPESAPDAIPTPDALPAVLRDPFRDILAPAPTAGPAVVKGFKCARQHHNDPRVTVCAVCGMRMDERTGLLTDGVRPPLGLLLFDDGTIIILDADCVLGREPEHSAAARRGARPVRLDDASGGMSRTHAEIRLIDWDVTVLDLGSANGTHLRAPGHPEWTRVIPGHPQPLRPGAQILLGARTATFDSQHGQV
ncbi:FHA domain-containing protein [Nocardia sp. XZ_19_385]|uniref:FHA domain-containing protein n=1 Tax=Nocardia sp. XZ_19_385 TaxID=2769488 RepID=UPI00188EA6A4|nr:FHA domain-containing protein [Nocardia sp. XZ_19_385]